MQEQEFTINGVSILHLNEGCVLYVLNDLLYKNVRQSCFQLSAVPD